MATPFILSNLFDDVDFNDDWIDPWFSICTTSVVCDLPDSDVNDEENCECFRVKLVLLVFYSL